MWELVYQGLVPGNDRNSWDTNLKRNFINLQTKSKLDIQKSITYFPLFVNFVDCIQIWLFMIFYVHFV